MPEPEPRPIREILLATDFSDTAEAAARVARQHARRWGARVHVLHASWPEEVAVTEMLAGQVEQLGTIPSVVRTVGGGPAARAIVDYARDNAIDLIVIGTHGRTGFSRALLGSVAEAVTRTAPCPVLVVPGREQQRLVREAVGVEHPSQHACLVCAQPSAELICEHCRAVIRGEALERKLRDERAGRA